MKDKISNLIYSIAQVTGIADEQMVRKAALSMASYYEPSNYSQEDLLNSLYLYLADGQEERAIVHQFRQTIDDLREEVE